jgi:hypothetical protein
MVKTGEKFDVRSEKISELMVIFIGEKGKGVKVQGDWRKV